MLACQLLDAVRPRQVAPFGLKQADHLLLVGNAALQLGDAAFTTARLVLEGIEGEGGGEHHQHQDHEPLEFATRP